MNSLDFLLAAAAYLAFLAIMFSSLHSLQSLPLQQRSAEACFAAKFFSLDGQRFSTAFEEMAGKGWAGECDVAREQGSVVVEVEREFV